VIVKGKNVGRKEKPTREGKMQRAIFFQAFWAALNTIILILCVECAPAQCRASARSLLDWILIIKGALNLPYKSTAYWIITSGEAKDTRTESQTHSVHTKIFQGQYAGGIEGLQLEFIILR